MVKPKPAISLLIPYSNGRHASQLFQDSTRVMKLDSNESSVPPSPRVTAALTEFIQNSPLNWYPDIESEVLRAKLSHYTGLPISQIQTFNGSDNALEVLCKTYLSPDDQVVIPIPTYDHFRVYAESCDTTIIHVLNKKNPFTISYDQLKKSINPKVKMVYLVHPNNPTGFLFERKKLAALLDFFPETLFIVDEAYFEFTQNTMASLVTHHDNLVVTRSFSKAFGLAGLRCGYILTQEINLEAINKVRIGKNVNTLAQVAAAAALEDFEYVTRYTTEVKTTREWLADKMRSVGLSIVETPANYILVELNDPEKVLQLLENQKIFVRNRSNMVGLDGFVRITIGHQHLMERFWKVFQSLPREILFSTHKKQKMQA